MSRRTQRILGLLALAASLFYLGRVAVRHAASLPAIDWTPGSLAAVAGAIGLYMVSLLAGALAWFLLLRGGGQDLGEAGRRPPALSPNPSPVRPSHTRPERERGATAQPQKPQRRVRSAHNSPSPVRGGREVDARERGSGGEGLRRASAPTVSSSPALRAVLVVCALGQAAKYVPGNVGQYLGRAVLARRYGVSLRDSAFTLLLETAGLILAAAACGALASGTSVAPGGRIALLAAAAVAAPCLFLIGVRWLAPWLRAKLPAAWREKLGSGPLPIPSAATLIACLALYVLSFCSGGGAVHLLARGLFAVPPGAWTLAVPAFALSWVAGFVTPGAPGGLGVREALLVAGTAPFYGPGPALSVALALRVVTVLGDGLAFLLGLAFKPLGHSNVG